MIDLTKAPGCYGAASVHNPQDEVCQRCEFSQHCGNESRATLDRLKERINVTDLLRRYIKKPAAAPESPAPAPAASAPVQAARAVPVARSPVVPVRVTPLARVVAAEVPDEDKLLGSLPVKPREIAQRLLRAGRVDAIKNDVQAGRNPFAQSKPDFLRVAFDRLLAGGCSRSALKQCFQDQLDWSDGTAGSHAGITTSLFLWLGIVRENGSTLEVNK